MGKPYDNKPTWGDLRRWLNPSHKPIQRRRGTPNAPICFYKRTPYLDAYGEQTYYTACGHHVDTSKAPLIQGELCEFCGQRIMLGGEDEKEK